MLTRRNPAPSDLEGALEPRRRPAEAKDFYAPLPARHPIQRAAQRGPIRSSKSAPVIDVKDVSLRHDMPLRNFDVEVRGKDFAIVLPVQARDPISAVATASYRTSREWSVERLQSVHTIAIKRS